MPVLAMGPEIGHLALVLALVLAFAQAWFGLAGAATGRVRWIDTVRPAVVGQFVFVAIAFASLTVAFVNNDFSVLYVATNSNTELPLIYRISAVWGAHEGSLLLWILMLSGWSLAVAMAGGSLPKRFFARVVGVMGLVSIGFLLFTLLTSSPFERLLPAAVEGRDLNPLLQDPALAIHPPMLYMGYVGFSVAFAFAIAAMLEGRLDQAWARWTRPWTTSAWLFLTCGIALGSWWAYYELGWGGWWFWDPVENASFMPWLVGTALIHSLAVTEKRGLFASWTLLLAVFAFSLSLLGTFLVRSGVLVSVHAFASDPARGRFILMFLIVVVGGALLLYGLRAHRFAGKGGFQPLSRETFLLANNVLLVFAALVVLFGTLYPLFLDALGKGKISVGPPWFELWFMVPMLPLVVLMGFGMHAAWRKAQGATLRQRLLGVGVVAGVTGLALPFVYGGNSVMTAVGVACAVWIVGSSLVELWLRRNAGRWPPASVLAMVVAHIGVGVFVLGVTVTSSYSIEKDVALKPGESVTVAGFDFRFTGIVPVSGPNYEAQEGSVEVRDGDRLLGVLKPQKRVYRVQRNPMTEADIDASLPRDLYAALGESLGEGAWSVRVQYKPLVRLIWLGPLIMALGGIIATLDRRYRAVRRTAEAPAATGLGTAGS